MLLKFSGKSLVNSSAKHMGKNDSWMYFADGYAADRDGHYVTNWNEPAAAALNHPEDLYNYEGKYCMAIHDLGNQTVTISNDLFGINKLYYYRTASTLIISSDIDSILQSGEHGFTVNYDALCELSSIGILLGNKTVVNEIFTLYRTEVICFDMETGGDHRYFYDRLHCIANNPKVTYNDAVENVVSLFGQALKYNLNLNADSAIKSIVALSGGWDSRLISGSLKKLGVDFTTHTTEIDTFHNMDVGFAKNVADFLAVPNKYTPLDESYFEDDINSYLNFTDYSTTLHPWLYHYYFNTHFAPNAINFDGFGGDILLRDGYIVKNRDNAYRELKFLKTENFVSKPTARMIEQVVQRNIDKEYSRLGDYHNQSLFFTLENRNMRNMSYCIKIQEQKLRSCTPFLHKPFIEFVLSIPEKIRYSKSFYPDVLKSVMPGLETLASTNTVHLGMTTWQLPKKINPHVIQLAKSSLLRHVDKCYSLVDPLQARNAILTLADENENIMTRVAVVWTLQTFLLSSLFAEKYKAVL